MVKPIISLTEQAKDRFRQVLPENKKVKLTLSTKGCSGFSYKLVFVDEISNLEIMASEEIPLIIEQKDLMYLLGTEIDYHEGILQSEFIFTNPLAKSCGCGKSISFDQEKQ